jgi:hypothetical protein
MMAMLTGQHSDAGAAVHEAQVGAVQAIIQANYDTFLASKHMTSRFPDASDATHGCLSKDDGDRQDMDTASDMRSEREAIERIFISERSASDGSGRESASTQAGQSAASCGTANSRSASDGSGAMVASGYADGKGVKWEVDAADE